MMRTSQAQAREISMSVRTTFTAIATAFILGTGALIAGSLATSTSAEAAPGWHGGGHHGHVRHDFRHPGRHWGWGRPGWGYRPVYARGYYGGCYRVLRRGFVPGVGPVVRPVTICR
jgi:hypothetical protein